MSDKEEKPQAPKAILPSASDFDDLSMFSGVSEDAGEYRDEAKEFADRAPISYLDEGNYWLRFYPEVKIEADGSRKMHVMRRFWSYTGLAKGVRRLPAPLGDCPVRAEVTRLKEAKLDDAWKYQAKEEAVLKVYIERWSGPKDHKYIKTQKPMFVVLRRKQVTALAEFLADLKPEGLRKVLNYHASNPLIKLSYTKGSGGNASFGFDIEEITPPALEENFPSLFTVLLDESKVATPDEVQKIRREVNRILSQGSKIFTPEGDEAKTAGPSSSSAKSDAAAEAVRMALAQSAASPTPPPVAPEAKQAEANSAPTTSPTEPVAEPAKVIPITPVAEVAAAVKAEAPNVSAGPVPVCPRGGTAKFGESHDDSNMDCIVCPHEPECVAKQTTFEDVPT